MSLKTQYGADGRELHLVLVLARAVVIYMASAHVVLVACILTPITPDGCVGLKILWSGLFVS